jgi:hypothetical protein
MESVQVWPKVILLSGLDCIPIEISIEYF